MKKVLLIILIFTLSCKNDPQNVDILITGGTIHNGTGIKGFIGNVAIKGDTIYYVGKSKNFIARDTINASSKIVSPGFINMLSWGYNTLLQDGRSLSDLKQGVTLEVFGEGSSPGPTGNIEDNNYVSFGEAMENLELNGISTNIASYLGATTVRIQEIGYANRKATPDEMDSMRNIVKISMEEGAIGIGSSLIYAPADYADTDELIELSKVASSYGGRYISHMRNEDSRVVEAVYELLQISEKANIPSQIYHLKASRKPNWHLLDSVITLVEDARQRGLKITADMYTYPASSTGLTGVIPTWVQEGGREAWINRMKRSDIRERLFEDIRKELSEQPPEDILMVGFNKQSMSDKYRGMTIAEAAEIRGESPEEAIVNLIIEDGSRIQCIYFSMSEENVRKKIQLPWVSFDSDAGSYSDISKDFITHPRAFGSFARVLGKYVRDEKLISMEEAIRRLSGFPAENLGIKKRGVLKEGNFADVVVFDPNIISDKATFEEPLQFAVGVEHVIVNGTPVISNGDHTGEFPGRFVKGPGYNPQLP
ncbi:MAG: D-aminoacylase [Bacteroidota bacterium]